MDLSTCLRSEMTPADRFSARDDVYIQFWPANGEISGVVAILQDLKASGYWKKIEIVFKPLTDEVLDALFALIGDLELNFCAIDLDNRPLRIELQQNGHVCWYPYGKGGKK